VLPWRRCVLSVLHGQYGLQVSLTGMKKRLPLPQAFDVARLFCAILETLHEDGHFPEFGGEPVRTRMRERFASVYEGSWAVRVWQQPGVTIRTLYDPHVTVGRDGKEIDQSSYGFVLELSHPERFRIQTPVSSGRHVASLEVEALANKLTRISDRIYEATAQELSIQQTIIAPAMPEEWRLRADALGVFAPGCECRDDAGYTRSIFHQTPDGWFRMRYYQNASALMVHGPSCSPKDPEIKHVFQGMLPFKPEQFFAAIVLALEIPEHTAHRTGVAQVPEGWQGALPWLWTQGIPPEPREVHWERFERGAWLELRQVIPAWSPLGTAWEFALVNLHEGVWFAVRLVNTEKGAQGHFACAGPHAPQWQSLAIEAAARLSNPSAP
jgi:hypothetical protein